MTKGACLALGTLLFGIALLAVPSGCSKLPPPSPIDYSISQTKSDDQSLVLGRFRIVEYRRDSPFLPWRRESHDWGKPKAKSFGMATDANIFMLYIDGGSLSEPVYYIPQDDGTFIWTLGPGSYQLARGYYQKDEKAWEVYFPKGGGSFVVPEGEPVVYIGTLTVLLCDEKNLDNLEDNRESFCLGAAFIENDLESAKSRMRELAPGVEQIPTVQLMTGFSLVPPDSLLNAPDSP